MMVKGSLKQHYCHLLENSETVTQQLMIKFNPGNLKMVLGVY